MKIIYTLLSIFLINSINASILIDINEIINENDTNNNNNGILTIINQEKYKKEVFKCNTTQLNNSHIITYKDCIINPQTNQPYDNIIYNVQNNKLGKIYIEIEGFKNNSNYKRGLDDKLIVSLNVMEEIAILKFNHYFIRNNCYLKQDKVKVTKGNKQIIIRSQNIKENCLRNQKIEPYIWYNIELDN